MPCLWPLLPSAAMPPIQQTGVPIYSSQSVDGVTFTFRNVLINAKSNVATFTNGVIVKYEETTIHADTVTVDQKGQHASAKGHVHVDDPTGTVDSDNIEVWWNKESRRSVINHGEVRVGSAHLTVDRLDIAPKLWVMLNARGTTSRATPPWYEVRARKVTLFPGKYGKLTRPSLYLFGHLIGTFPDRTFNLDPRSEGLGLPSLAFSNGQFGTNWQGGLFVDHSTDFAFALGAFPGSFPSYGGSLTHTYLPDEKSTTYLTPTSNFGEMFSEGYFESIHVSSPSQEDGNLRYARKSLAFDSNWNVSPTGQRIDLLYDQPAEVVFDLGGPLGKFAYMSQTRLQTIKQLDQNVEARAIVNDALGLPAVKISRDIRTLARIDMKGFLGPRDFAWARLITGLAYEPVKQVRLSAAGYLAADSGRPDYQFDRLASINGCVFRGDFDLGPTKFTFMSKYDPRLGWFDHEYTFSQVVGCFEPFILYREYPNEYAFGLRLSIGNLTDLITRRNFVRPGTTKTVISPGPDGKP
ncbi:MAG: LptA/OstA family protein [Fimbriimonas sp.]|nr:LptA/OstA family protein [Fimbriimonas sp.]